MEHIVIRDTGLDRAIDRALRCLRQGGVIAAPTETVYGLMTYWGNEPGRDRIFQLKQRPRDKRLQMLASDLHMAYEAGVLADLRLDILGERFWPGPLTVVANAEHGQSIGLRLPDNTLILGLLQKLGKPLAATSANRSGQPPAVDAESAVAGLQGVPDLLIDGGHINGGCASTVISLLEQAPRILRAGPVSENAVRTILNEMSA